MQRALLLADGLPGVFHVAMAAHGYRMSYNTLVKGFLISGGWGGLKMWGVHDVLTFFGA